MRWSNVPIPGPHEAAILGAAGLQFVLPLRLPGPPALRWVLAGPVLAGGIGLAAWAVASAGDADVERDTDLVTAGAYGLTRNPMYVGWSAGVLGTALASGSAWLLVAWLVAVRALDREIVAEEARLHERFGASYSAYLRKVPRYLPAPAWQIRALIERASAAD